MGLLVDEEQEGVVIDHGIKNTIGALAVFWTLEQRLERILNFYSKGIQMKSALENEISFVPHFNWSPKKRPEWLLLEIGMNL